MGNILGDREMSKTLRIPLCITQTDTWHVDTQQDKIDRDGVYAFLLNREHHVMKVTKQPSGLIASYDNPDYPDTIAIKPSDDLVVIGRVTVSSRCVL